MGDGFHAERNEVDYFSVCISTQLVRLIFLFFQPSTFFYAEIRLTIFWPNYLLLVHASSSSLRDNVFKIQQVSDSGINVHMSHFQNKK
jgi:hypothetical protein